ncbi:hypothetical protein V6N12_001272 [Hibiscus sabdariffa]|uniref:TIR domain-containing protein n=1 Tax=Hibiscus sabdariffa TaxID=183260 RepID=A0ABR2C741_9ROSI
MDCKRSQGHVVLPIFYHVDPSHVGTSSDRHKSKKWPDDALKQWKSALVEVSKLKGWHIEGGKFDRPETEHIKDIVGSIKQKLVMKHQVFLSLGGKFNRHETEYIKEIVEDVIKELVGHASLEMGKEIVSHESYNPGERSRLWNPKDVYHVLKYNKGTESIEGIKLDMSDIDNLWIHHSAFENMLNLRYIQFYDPHGMPLNKKFYTDGADIVYLPSELRYLRWDYYPFQSLPSSFNPKNLAVLRSWSGKLEQLWNENDCQDLGNLREIDLSNSKNLRKISNLSGAVNLKILCCNQCESLVELPCLDNLTSLERLELSGCKNLRKISNLSGAVNLKFLCCNQCESLVELPCLNDLTSLERLELSGCKNLRKISNLSGAVNLKFLCCNQCESLVELPCLNNLTSLERLELSGCKNLRKISNLSGAVNLKFLCCNQCESLVELPCLNNLTSLERLELSGCKNLRKIPNLSIATNLKILCCNQCESLVEFPCLVHFTAHKEVTLLSFLNCFRLNQDSVHNIESNAMLQIQSLAESWASRDSRLGKKYLCCFPGSEISENDFEYQSVNSSLKLKIIPNSRSESRFLAFAICLVANLTCVNEALAFNCEYQLAVAGGEMFKDECRLYFDMHGSITGDHVFILFSEDMIRINHGYDEASFKVNIENIHDGKEIGVDDIKVEKCGVHVFYVDTESDGYIEEVVGNFDSHEDYDTEEVQDYSAREMRPAGHKRKVSLAHRDEDDSDWSDKAELWQGLAVYKRGGTKNEDGRLWLVLIL